MPRAPRVFAVALSFGLAAAKPGVPSEGVSGPVLERFAIDVSVDPAAGTLAETATLTVRAPGLTHLVFTLDEGLVVKRSATSAGVVDYRQAGPELIVDVDPPIDGTRTLTFTVGGRPGAHSASTIAERHVVLAPSTPWYPSLPSVWATGTVTVHAPDGWRALATGLPVRSGWAVSKAVRSLAVVAAPGLSIHETTLPEARLVFAGPSSLSVTKVDAVVRPAFTWFSGALAPYPFEAFTVVVLPDYSGRMEASGLVVVGRDAPLGAPTDGADLLAGQWFGQLVAGDGAWIDAFAAWEACVFARDRGLPIPETIAAARASYFALRSGDVPIATASFDAPSAVLRGKGSAAPDMVRLIAGDRATFDAVRELFAKPGPSPVSLESVRGVLEKHAGHPLARAFDEWFGRAGAPEISATLSAFPASSGGFRADLQLVQKRARFELPVDVVIYGPGGERRETVEIADELTSVFYVVPFEPKRVEIDPLNRIFRWK